MGQVNKVFLISGNAGQGKTTIAKNLAFCLRNFGFDVLLVDGDLKTPKLCHHVGMPLANHTIQDVLLGARSLKDAIYQRPSGIKLLLSGLNFVDVSHPSILLPQLKKLADVVIIDVPTLDVKWYDTKCETILVTQPDFPSVLEVQKLSKLCNVHSIIINRMHDDGVDLSPDNVMQVVHKPLLGVIPAEPLMREALRHGYPLVEFHPELQASNSLKQIAAKLMNLEYTSPVRAVSILAKLGLVS
jgi:MinD-like ATPase involved in chromosome partitioning or flagellar assembly